MNSLRPPRGISPPGLIFRSLLAAILASVFAVPAPADTARDLRKWFNAANDLKNSDKREAAQKKIVALGDKAVPFLVEILRSQKPRPVEYWDTEGHHKVMGTWSQEAESLLISIDTVKVVTEMRKLSVHEDAEVRSSALGVLTVCATEREANIMFLRSRVEAEGRRTQEGVIGMLKWERNPDDIPLFKRLLEKSKDLHVRLALWCALGMQGDKDAVLEIVNACEKYNGHMGMNYLGQITGKRMELNQWRAWLTKISAGDFRKVLERHSRPQDVCEGGWETFLSAVTCLQETGDRAKAAGLFKKVAQDFPKSDYADEAAELATLLEKMVAEDRVWQEPADPAKLAPDERAAWIVHHLRDVDCYQTGQPGECDILAKCGRHADRPNPALELLKLADAAIPALVAILDDRRPTRSVGYWRDFAKSRTVLRYQDVAVRILGQLAQLPFYQRATTSGYFSLEEAERRAAIIEVMRVWFEEGRDQSPAERKWLAYHQAEFYPAGVSILETLIQDDGQKDPVLAELRRMYAEDHWAYRPLIAKMMADMGDASKVKEVLAGKDKFNRSHPLTSELKRAHSASESALDSLAKPAAKKEKGRRAK